MNPLRSAIVVLALCAAVEAQVPTTRGAAADDSETVRLKAENKMLQTTLEQRDKELVTLREEVRALKAQLAGAFEIVPMSTTAPATRPAVAKRIVIPFSTLLPSKPLAELGIGRAGKSDPSKVLRVVSILGEDSVLVDNPPLPPPPADPSNQHITITVLPSDPRGQGEAHRVGTYDPAAFQGPPPPTTIPVFILEGIPTEGMVVGQHLPDLPFKVVSTRKVGGKTYFVAWPVVKEGQVPQGRK